MATGLLKDIIGLLPKQARLLGLDVGKKTIGLSVSDHLHNVATPLRTIERTKFTKDMQEIVKIIADYEIGGFVIGLPLNMDGSEGPACQSIRDFAAEMAKTLGKDQWIALWDERLSTASVHDFVDNSMDINVQKAKKRGIVDKLAAQHILQGALEFITATQPKS